MLYRWRWPLLFTVAALLLSQTAGFAGTPFAPWSADRPLLHLARKPVIDKSCIMMCDQWGEHGCLKWVMRCKGDPGYPKGLSIAQ